MNRSFVLAWLVVLILGVAGAAPNRKPHGPTGPEEPKGIDLTKVREGEGAAFGDWILWRHQVGGASIFMINQKTGLGVYLPWSSNGWINHRAGGTWYVLFPTGAPQLQDRADLNIEAFVGKQTAVRLAPGQHVIENWSITITPDTIDFKCSQIPAHMTFQRNSPEFTHNGRTIGR